MPDNFILLYITTVFVASIIPGPSMLLALSHGMQYGAKRSIASAMGNVMVTVAQAVISIAGLGILLISSEIAFQVIKLAGAIFLVYMGIGLLRSSQSVLTAPEEDSAPKEASLPKMFTQAAVVTAGNPKAIVFFTAVFPQFIDPNVAYLPQSCLLLSLGSLTAFTCFMMYAISGEKAMILFSKTSIEKYLNKIFGGTFIGTGIGLIVSETPLAD